MCIRLTYRCKPQQLFYVSYDYIAYAILYKSSIKTRRYINILSEITHQDCQWDHRHIQKSIKHYIVVESQKQKTCRK